MLPTLSITWKTENRCSTRFSWFITFSPRIISRRFRRLKGAQSVKFWLPISKTAARSLLFLPFVNFHSFIQKKIQSLYFDFQIFSFQLSIFIFYMFLFEIELIFKKGQLYWHFSTKKVLKRYIESPKNGCKVFQTYDIDLKFCMVIVHVVLRNQSHSSKTHLNRKTGYERWSAIFCATGVWGG